MAAKIRNFRCGSMEASEVCEDVTRDLDMEFPEAYTRRDTMAELSLVIKDANKEESCILPFCRTIEAEALGANINMGDANAGPRGGLPVCTTLEELQNLPEIDFSTGRAREVLEACRILKEKGENVGLEIAGPWTTLTTLMEPRTVFKLYRKNREEMKQVLRFIATQSLSYIDAAREVGVDIIIYSDSAGSVDILGPRVAEQSVEDVNAWFVEQAIDHLGDQMVLQICPKIVYALVDTGAAKFVDHEVPKGTTFLQALLDNRETVKVVGQVCIKIPGARLAHGKLREIVLV